MGTSALTVIYETSNRKLVSIYTQGDGDPECHGIEIAEFLRGLKIVDGIGLGPQGRIANGMGCLAAQLIATLKTRPGETYIADPRLTWDPDYEYHIKQDYILVKESAKRLFHGPWLDYQT